MAAVPAALVPIRFPSTRVPVVPALAIRTPSLPLPEITLPASSAVPPTTLFVLALAPKTATPWPPFPGPGCRSRPGRCSCPRCRLFAAPRSPPLIWTPSSGVARDDVAVGGGGAPDAVVVRGGGAAADVDAGVLPRAAVPATFVPRKFPAMTLFDVPSRRMPRVGQLLMHEPSDRASRATAPQIQRAEAAAGAALSSMIGVPAVERLRGAVDGDGLRDEWQGRSEGDRLHAARPMLKLIVSTPASAFASSMAARRVHDTAAGRAEPVARDRIGRIAGAVDAERGGLCGTRPRAPRRARASQARPGARTALA